MPRNHLVHRCLLAAPQVQDSLFQRSVIYIVRHDDDGTLGLIINRPSHVTLHELLDDLQIERQQLADHQVMHGGPVHPEVGLVMHTGQPVWHASIAVSENVCITSSKDVLEALAEGQPFGHYQIMLGYSAWSPGQLDDELKRGDWLICEPDLSLLFEVDPPEKWQMAADRIGFRQDWLAEETGHA